MPSPLKKVHTQTFVDGIDTSTAPELVAPGRYKYMLNCSVSATGKGNVGIVTNIKGNTLITTPLPSGENKTIGVAKDSEKNKFYFFVWNENGYHSIFEYNGLSKSITLVLQSITDTGGFDVLNFNKDYLILMANVVRNKMLYWVDGLNDARKINIQKALDKSLTGYGPDVLEEFINAYKLAPSAAPLVSYFSDVAKGINRLYGGLRKFCYRFIYDDGEKSNWSDYSNVPLPPKESYTGVNSIPTDNNGIKLTIQTGSRIVIQIEIAMFSPKEDLPNPVWYSIATLDKKKLSIADNSIFVYNFYNDGSYPVTDTEKILRPYSFLPKAPLCQAMTERALTYFNFNEGFPDVPINTTLSVTYDDLFIESGIENKFNSPSFSFTDIPNTGAYLYNRNLNHGQYRDLDNSLHFVTADKRANSLKVIIGNDVKKGNVYNGQMTNGVKTYSVSYEAKITDTATTVANEIKQQLLNQTGGNGGNIIRQIMGNVKPAETQPETNIYINSTDGLGNVSFVFSMIDYTNGGYYFASASVNPVQFNTLKDTGQSISNVKMGAGIKFGIMYEDFQGRRSLVYTDDSLIVTTDTQNAQGGLKAISFTLTIKHQPPVWARYYQIVRTKDLTYANFIQMITQKVIDVPATNSGGDYLDLVVGSLYTYQKIHPNTTLKYTFKKGDRIRFITKGDGTYYPFFETEVLSYKDVTEELINSNLTVDGSDTVTVASANPDNIGRFILVDNNEREILAAPTSTTYTLGASIGSSGQAPYLSYKLIDRRGLIRIRKPFGGIVLEDNSLMEVFTPSASGDDLSQKQFLHFNKKFEILNAGTDTRYHSANQQQQNAIQDAIVKITEGTVYVRNREWPITNTIPNAQVVIKSVEDSSYSDFYYSALNDNGRENVEDTKMGVVKFGSRGRFSNISLEDTSINGLNDFDNLDREDYYDEYGEFKLTVYTENGILAFKTLKDMIIPVFQTIIQDNAGQDLLGASKKLLNAARYYSHDDGIGNNPESYCRKENNHYHSSANSGCWVRIGGDGITPISEIYFFDNEARNILANAANNNTKIFGVFDPVTKGPIWYVEGYDTKTYFQGFDTSNWKLLNDALPEDQVYTIVTPPAHGTLTFPNGNPFYQADAGYSGGDSFTYSTVVNGQLETQKVCLTVVAPVNRQTAWRPKVSSYVCVSDEDMGQTGYKEATTLEEYYTDNGTLTGNEKPNSDEDPDYSPPVYDDVACPITIPEYAFKWVADEDTKYCVTDDIVINEFDFLVIRYLWDYPAAGRDLDIQVQFENNGISAVDNKFVGFGNTDDTVPNGAAPETDSYLWWGLDDTNSSSAPQGIEGVLVGLNKFVTDFPASPNIVEVDLYAVWYNSVLTGNFTLEIATYKGGTMSKVGTNIINTGGTAVSLDSRSLNTLVQNTTHTPATSYHLGKLLYDKTTKIATLNLL